MGTVRQDLLDKVFQSCIQEYADKQNTFVQIDNKAQTTASVAGVLIAAALAFVQADSVQHMVGAGRLTVVILTASAIVLLLLSTFFCLMAMRIRRLTAPLPSKEIERMVEDIFHLNSSEFTDQVVENFVRDQVNAWQQSLRSLEKTNMDKANRVLWGQGFLAAAVLLVAIVVSLFLVQLSYKH